MKIRFVFFFALIFAVCGTSAFAQKTAATTAPGATTTSAASTSPVAKSAAPGASTSPAGSSASKSGAPAVPSEYRSISLGSGLDAVKEQLLADPLFGYRGERDVSLLPGENRSLIETTGASFIRRAWFQFSEDKLYIMTLSLDPEKIDYYSIYSHLVEKYGEPTTLDPRKALWGDDKTTLSLERPLTVKYTNVEIFKKLLDSDTTGKAASDIAREGFVNEF